MTSLQVAPVTVVHEAIDERQFVRTQFPACIVLALPAGAISCTVLDISLGGAKLDCKQELQPGSILNATLQVDLQPANLSVTCKVKVAGKRGNGLGIEFIDLDRNRRDILRYLMSCFMAGEIANVNGTLNVLQRENYIRQRKGKAATSRTRIEQFKAIAGSLAFLLAGVLICATLLYKSYLYFFRVEAAHAIVTTDAYVLAMPDNGYLRFLINPDTTSVKAGTAIASVSSQLAASFNTPSDVQALANLSQADVQLLMGRTLIETVISSPCDCTVHAPAKRMDRYGYKYDEVLHLLPENSELTVKASFPFARLRDVSNVTRVQLTVFGSTDVISGRIVGSELDSLNDMLVLIIEPAQPLPRDWYRKPVAVDVFTAPAFFKTSG